MRLLCIRLCLSTVVLVCALAAPYALARSEGGNDAVSIDVEAGETVALYDESHALVVGIGSYDSGWPRLEGVRRDIAAVQPVLEKHGFRITVVEDPTRSELLDALERFIREYGFGTRNRLLVYFAGHGHTESQDYGGEMGYLVTADATRPAEDRQGFLSKAISMQEIESYARRIQTLHALFVFDACFAGTIFTTVRSAAPAAVSYKAARPVRQFIASGSAEEQVPDESIFRAQFVAGLEGAADVNGDGYVTGTELGEFLMEKVIHYSDDTQHPQYGKLRDPVLDKGDFVFELPEHRTKVAPTRLLLEEGPALPRFPYRLEFRDVADGRVLENGSIVRQGEKLDVKLVRDPSITTSEDEVFFFQVVAVDQAWHIGRLIRDDPLGCSSGVHHSFGVVQADTPERDLMTLEVFPPFGNDFFVLLAAREREVLCDLLARPVADLLVGDHSQLSDGDLTVQRLWIRSTAAVDEPSGGG